VQIHYLNTDLDLAAPVDLELLVAAFESQGICPLQRGRREDGDWWAILEASKSYDDPESNIEAMLTIVEQLDELELKIWQALTCCEFNIGYDSGTEPWGFNQGLSHELLQRITKAGASVRFTLYPPES
jgi:hypothetical protein